MRRRHESDGRSDMGTTTIDHAEIEKFEAMAAEWWDPNGKFRPLHLMNPCRLDYIVAQIAVENERDPRAPTPFKGIRILDIGCGGGLLCEPLARLGATVVGADASRGNIEVARSHATSQDLEIDYRATTAEVLAESRDEFDVVLAMEIIEHVSNPHAFLSACSSLLRPKGLLILSTLNRTRKSYAAAIVAAERILRWLPAGTHDWNRFVTPDELFALLDKVCMDPIDKKGMVFHPLRWDWTLSQTDFAVNYVTSSLKRSQIS